MDSLFAAFDVSGPAADIVSVMAACIGIALIVVICAMIGRILFGVSPGGSDDD
jgi:hypothetical protein